MTNAEIKQRITNKLENLTKEQLTLIDNLLTNISSCLQNQQTSNLSQKSEQERKDFIRSFRGKYAHISTSSEDFARRKQEEIDWENRHR